MKRTATLEINCGETTCASEPGSTCEYWGTRRLGTISCCMLFPSEERGPYTDLEDKDGWIQRCEDCMNLFR